MNTKLNTYGRVDNNYLFNPLHRTNNDNLNSIDHLNFTMLYESTNISDKVDEKFQIRN